MSIEFDAEDRGLKYILDGHEKYEIPRYQRPYSWTNDEVLDLWNDLEDEDSVFLGSFVFNYAKQEKEGFVEVIDGQQRLVTFMILSAVLRDLYKELGDRDRENMTQEILAHRDSVYLKEDYRLKCGESLNDFFHKYIQKRDLNISEVTPKRKEEKLIKEHYLFFKDKIGEKIEQIPDKSLKIKYLDDLKYKLFNFKIIWIKIGKDDDAYSIFETVNARGADLTAANLLKNYLFSKLQKKHGGIDRAKSIWLDMESNIENTKGRLNISKAIRYYWLSRYKFTTEKKLYKAVKTKIKAESECSDFLEKINIASEYYFKIANDSVDASDWEEDFKDKKPRQNIVEALNGLRIMGITQCYPLIFCLLMNKEKIGYDFSDIFKVIEKYHFAYSAVCKLSGNVVERLYNNTSIAIQAALQTLIKKNRIKNIQRELANFKNKLIYPSKDMFIEKFMDIGYGKKQLVRYILSKIEQAKAPMKEGFDSEKINIEHILPQKPQMWGLTKKDIKDYVNKLGNLTIISKKINGTMQNATLKVKVKIFKESNLTINKELVAEFKSLKYKWGKSEIEKRQKELAKYAYDVVWKFK